MFICQLGFSMYTVHSVVETTTNNEDIINTLDIQIQKLKKSKDYNKISILILDNILI